MDNTISEKHVAFLFIQPEDGSSIVLRNNGSTCQNLRRHNPEYKDKWNCHATLRTSTLASKPAAQKFFPKTCEPPQISRYSRVK